MEAAAAHDQASAERSPADRLSTLTRDYDRHRATDSRHSAEDSHTTAHFEVSRQPRNIVVASCELGARARPAADVKEHEADVKTRMPYQPCTEINERRKSAIDYKARLQAEISSPALVGAAADICSSIRQRCRVVGNVPVVAVARSVVGRRYPACHRDRSRNLPRLRQPGSACPTTKNRSSLKPLMDTLNAGRGVVFFISFFFSFAG